MKNIDMKYVCTIIGNLSGIPVRLFEGETRIFYHSFVHLPCDPMPVYKDDIWRINTHVGYFVTEQFNYYGIVNSGDLKFIIGPTSQAPNSDRELRELAFQADVAPEDVDEFAKGMKSIVRMPLESVMQMLCTVNYILNDEKLELKDVAIFDSEQSSLNVLLERQRSTELLAPSQPDQPPQQVDLHNTYQVEQQMLRMIRKGDTAALNEWISSAPAVRGGTVAADQLRQIKNIFVVTTTLVSRAAIHGGMEIDEAFSLSDAYIQKCELLNSLERITNLQYHMVLEYAERVRRIQIGGQSTKLVIDVSHYVQRHLSEHISVESIAAALFMSRPYLSRKFKQETGSSLTDFILMEKTEEAKRLLRYSDKSATAIGAYLGFSSLAHFSRVFRKYAGRTPTDYRERYAG